MNKITKTLIVFNPCMVYLLPAISRPYAMIPLIISLIILLYDKKEEHPYLFGLLLAWLVNTHLMMIPLAGMIVLLDYGEKLIVNRKTTPKEEKIKFYKSAMIVLVGTLFYMIPSILSFFECKLVEQFDIKIENFTQFLQVGEDMCFDTKMVFLGENNGIVLDILLGIFVFMIGLATRFDKKGALIFWVQNIFMLILFAFAWRLIIPQRAMLIIFQLMFWTCTYKPNLDLPSILPKKLIKNLLNIALILLTSFTMVNYSMVKSDLYEEYSTSERMAKYIEKNIPKGTIFIALSPENASGIIPYLGKGDYQFFGIGLNEFYTYVTWNENWIKWRKATEEDVDKAVKYLHSLGYKNLYVLNHNFEGSIYFRYIDLSPEKYEEIYRADEIFDEYYAKNETHTLYKVVE